MSLNFYLQKIFAGQSLGEAEAAGACEILLRQIAPSAPAGAVLSALHLRGETPDELVGFTQNLRKSVVPFEVEAAPLTDIVSLVPATLPSLTLGASIMLAACGAKVAKLMLKARSHAGGAQESDLLPSLGLNPMPTPEESARLIVESGLGFISATQHVPELRTIRMHQESLGVPTLLDWILPLAHPAPVNSLLLTVEQPKEVVAVAGALRRLRFDRGMIVASLDDPQLCPYANPVRLTVAELRNGRIHQDEYAPEDFGIRISPELTQQPGGGVPNALTQIGWLRAMIDRRPSPLTESVRWMATLALVAAGRAENVPEALALVDQAIRNDKPAATLARMEAATKRSLTTATVDEEA